MDYQRQQHAIAVSDTKHAALYFDRVFPLEFLTWREQITPSDRPFRSSGLSLPMPIAGNLVRGWHTYERKRDRKAGKPWEDTPDEELVALRRFMDCWELPFEALTGHRVNYEALDSKLDPIPGVEAPPDPDLEWPGAVDACLEHLARMGIHSPTIVAPESRLSATDSHHADLTVALMQIGLVDAHSASWEQICELRLDADAAQQLQDLRLFLFKNFAGKSVAFVEDDLLRRYTSYQAAANKHGFDTKIDTLRAVAKSRNLVLGASSALAVLLGQPALGAALATPIALDVAGITLQISKNRHSLAHYRNQHDLAYILTAKDRLES